MRSSTMYPTRADNHYAQLLMLKTPFWQARDQTLEKMPHPTERPQTGRSAWGNIVNADAHPAALSLSVHTPPAFSALSPSR
jgi:hypothetical protein